MKINEVRGLARRHGINSVRKSKVNLIREIQLSEGNFGCFGTASGYCDQSDCCFRPACVGQQTLKTRKLRIHNRSESGGPMPTVG